MSMIEIFKQEIQIQIQRYYRTRYGKIAALIILIGLYHLVSFVLRMVVPITLEHFSQSNAYILIFMSAFLIVTILYNGSLYFIYTMKIPFFEQYRVNQKKPWPWQQNPQHWYNKLVWRSIKITCLDIFVFIPLLLKFSFQIQFFYVMDVNTPTPLKTFLVQILIMIFLEDLIFFTTHKILHLPKFYKYHKTHHEYSTTVSIAGLHSSLVQFLVSNSVSAGIYMRIAGLYAPMHINTAIIWIITRMFDAYNGHSGYMFSWTPLQLLPFCTNDQFHDFHHSHNCGNYGSQFRYLDIIFGSNKDFRQYKMKKIKQKVN